MKTRENELHEPKIESESIQRCYDDYCELHYSVTATCPVCGHILSGYSVPDTSQEKRGYVNQRVRNELPNYCSKCGARLKEID